MYSELLEPLVINAINKYLRHLPDQTLEINTALATRTLPLLLETIIKEEILRTQVIEIRKALSQIYRTQLHESEHMLRFVPRDEVITRRNTHATEINQLKDRTRYLQQKIQNFNAHFDAETAPPTQFTDSYLIGVYPDEQRDYLLREIGTFNIDLQTQLFPLVNKIYSFQSDWQYPKYKLSEAAGYYINTLLVKMHWAKQIKSCHQQITDIQRRLDVLEMEYHKLDFVLTCNPELNDYVQMRKQLYIENANEFKGKVARLQQLYSFDRIDKVDLKDIFHKFVEALRPHVQFNEHFAHALAELDSAPKLKKDLADRKFTLLKILYEQKLKPAIKHNADRKNRINNLIENIKMIEIKDDTSLHTFVRAIISWQLAKVDNVTNNDAFHPSSLHQFFHPGEQHMGAFINHCLNLVSPGHHIAARYRSQPIDRRDGVMPVELTLRAVEMY